MNKKTFKDISVTGKRVLLRVDYNVPLDDNCNITDDTRIKATLPTISYLLKQNAKVIICSHLGRPNGVYTKKLSLEPVAKRLSKLINTQVKLASDVVGESAKKLVTDMHDGEVVMLENVRFYKEEESCDEEFCKQLASLADIFVNDAFGVSHRAHASTAGIAKYLPAVSGFLMGKEIMALSTNLEKAEMPFVLILGGAKVSDKIGVITNLINKASVILIGGAMANTFIAAKGGKLGYSRFEKDKVDVAKKILAEADKKNVRVILPVDVVASTEFSENGPKKTMDAFCIKDGYQAMDIGKKTCKMFKKEIARAKTIVWNGPMGVFEFKKYQSGTKAIAKAVAKNDGISVIGGGDSVAAIQKLGLTNKITHLSTGGGASLKLLEGANLPGVSMLLDK